MNREESMWFLLPTFSINHKLLCPFFPFPFLSFSFYYAYHVCFEYTFVLLIDSMPTTATHKIPFTLSFLLFTISCLVNLLLLLLPFNSIQLNILLFDHWPLALHLFLYDIAFSKCHNETDLLFRLPLLFQYKRKKSNLTHFITNLNHLIIIIMIIIT